MKLKQIVITLCALIAAGPVLAQNAASVAAASNPVIASGTGITITRGDLDEALSGYRAQIRTLSPADLVVLQKQMLTNLINEKLVLTKASDADKTAGQKAADLRITADIENLGSQQAFDGALRTNGFTQAQYRSKIADEETVSVALKRLLNITVSDQEVQSYYDAHTANFEQPEMAHVSHILIFTVDPVTQAALPDIQLLQRRRLAEQIVKASRSGADFEALAKQASEDPGTRASGGELLPFPRGVMSSAIDSAAFSMTNNQVSDVITTSDGYEIVKLLDRVPAKKTSYLTAAEQVRQILTRQKFQQTAVPYLDGLQRAANVQILDPTLAAPTPSK
ncbi:MAG TPA: peptidylprolyl isomerase [Verrucomicrobiae bacterium]|jgi:foldase protein PrsA